MDGWYNIAKFTQLASDEARLQTQVPDTKDGRYTMEQDVLWYLRKRFKFTKPLRRHLQESSAKKHVGEEWSDSVSKYRMGYIVTSKSASLGNQRQPHSRLSFGTGNAWQTDSPV